MKQHGHMGMHEVAELLGVSRQRVQQMRGTYGDFPKPAAVLRGSIVWHTADIEAWAARHAERPTGVKLPKDH